MKLLDALSKGRVLRVASQNCGLIQVFTAILDALDFDSNLNSSLFEIRVSPDTHGLSSSYLAAWSSEIRRLLIHCDSLVNVGLHQLVLTSISTDHALHTFVTTLTRVSYTFECISVLAIGWETPGLSWQWALRSRQRSVSLRVVTAWIGSKLGTFDLTLGSFGIFKSELVRWSEGLLLAGTSWHSAVSALVSACLTIA